MRNGQRTGRPDQGRTEVLDSDDVRNVNDVGALEQIARGEVDIQISTARRFPRSIEAFQKKALSMATIDEETAASCFYVLPKRKGAEKAIEGPSARLAEIAPPRTATWPSPGASSKRATASSSRRAPPGTSRTTCGASSKSAAASRVRDGGRYSDDMIMVTCNAAIAIATRNAVFQVIPQAYTRQIYHACREVAVGTQQTLSKRRGAMLEHFQKMGVEPARVFALLEVRGTEDITLEHLATLRGLATAIKEGDTSIDEAFPPAGQAHGADPVDAALALLPEATRARVLELFTQIGMNRGQRLVQLRAFKDQPDKLVEVLTGMLDAMKAEDQATTTTGDTDARQPVSPAEQSSTVAASSAPSPSSPASTPSTAPATAAKPTIVPKPGKYDF
jgi:hypothetical protein